MHGRARTFAYDSVLNVTYVFDSDGERGRSGSRLSGTTAVQEPSQSRVERDSTYVPADDEESDEDMYEGPAPSSYRKRPLEGLEAGGEGPTVRKSARLAEGGKNAAHCKSSLIPLLLASMPDDCARRRHIDIVAPVFVQGASNPQTYHCSG